MATKKRCHCKVGGANQADEARSEALNPECLTLTTGNPFWGTKLLGFNVGRGSGALKGLTQI